MVRFAVVVALASVLACQQDRAPTPAPGAKPAPAASAARAASAAPTPLPAASAASAPAPGAAAADLASFLPDALAGFTAGPLSRTEGYVRRIYTRGGVAIDLTLARRPQTAEEFAAWTKGSRDYPPAPTGGLPADAAAGFYDCVTVSGRETCSVHIQLRAGVHVEMMGGGQASRAEVTEMVGALRLVDLARSLGAPRP